MLTGLRGFVDEMLIPKMPSASGASIECDSSAEKLGLQRCSWSGGLVPSPGGNTSSVSVPKTKWLTVTTSRTGSDSIRISVQGRNTRACRLYFDSPISEYVVHHPKGEKKGKSEMQPGYLVGEDGIKEVRLWSRTWDREFTVDIKTRSSSTLTGRAACEWSEFESGSIGVGTGGKIPALEEMLTFLPKWAVVTKVSDGLVEVIQDFNV